eukprot:symbB.v1.2.011883.t2/scaffold806.1/size231046/10
MASLANGGKSLTQAGEVSTPSWDGSAKTWRRYLKEVQWYVLGTKPKLRRYLASRLIMRLSGSARLLAMTWQLSEFDNEDGVTTMLQKLSKSPLVRKTLPNAASIMAQYFEFRRLQGENISAFLIRENLHFEEFRERRRYQRVPQAEEETEEAPRVDEAVLSMSDSFILEQLRGWRLLTSASLNQEEWRDVLGACQGKLDYGSISEALQVLYDEQMIGSSRSRHGHPGQPQLFSLEDDWGEEDWSDYYDHHWESAYYQGWYDEWEEPWWNDQLLHDGGAGDEAKSSVEEPGHENGTPEQGDQDQMALSWSTQSCGRSFDTEVESGIQALYRVTVSSNLSGTRRAFTCFSLPDPEEIIQQSWFTPSMLVPVLLGMDFLHQVGAILDFTDGMCCFSQLGVTVNLPVNSKGHFLIDIADFLTDGQTCQNKSVHVQLRLMEHEEVHEEFEAKTCELEFFTMEGQVEDLKVYQSHKQKKHFVDMVQRRIDMNQQIGLMGNWLSQPSENSTTSSTTSHAEDREDRAGYGSNRGDGSQRSTGNEGDLALPWKSSGGQARREQICDVDSLLKVRSEDQVRTKERSTRKSVSFREPRDGEASSTRTMARTTGGVGAEPRVGQGDDREGHGRREDVSDAGRLPTHVGQEQEEGRAGQGGLGKVTQQRVHKPGKGFCSTFNSNFVDSCGTCITKGDRPLAVPDQRGERTSNADCTAKSSSRNERDGVGTQLQLKDPAEDVRKKMPLEVGRGINNLIDYLDKDFNGELAKVIYERGTVTWEMFCAPESGLTTEVRKQGLDGMRINLAGGYDLYKEKYYPHLRELRRKQRPRKFWVSTPCTPYCDWSELNYFYRWEVLEKKRRKEKGMHLKMMSFLLEGLEEDPLSELYWEWPLRCRGWKTSHMLEFQERLQALGREIFFCRIDGCRYGMKSTNGNHVKKSWTIMTTDIEFYNEFRLKACLGNHQHEWLHGTETTRSAYYPENLCGSIARLWRRQLLPDRWKSMLWTAPTILDPFTELFKDDKEEHELHAAEDLHPELPQPEGEEEPTREEREKWEARLSRFHRAAGHPTSRNMARVMADAQLPRWKVKAALDFKCSACQEAKLGGISSKEIGPASTRDLPNPFEHVGMDIAEWEVPGGVVKLKFILMMDMATKYKVTETMFTGPHGKIMVESADDLIRVFTLRWLMNLPRPHTIIPDKEVSSFLRTAAVRRCLDEEELREAKHSGRILKSRWVLVWKSVPDESREEALEDVRSNPRTTHRKDGTKKAKARIVVLGYQHPDLLDPETSTTAPVQSQIMRHLSFQVVAQRKWTLEGLDVATAFLQTGRSEENRKVWMEAVPELKRALQAEDHEVLRILKTVYGNATAPRGLWKDVDETFQRLGGKRMLGDNSFWTWTRPNPHPKNEADQHILIGFVGGHVDDFNRAGDLQDPEWLRIRAEIDKSYKWGTTKVNQYRHTGLDLQVKQEGKEYYVRKNAVKLRFWHIPSILHWQDATVVTLADQAHANRPRGDSTGGLITFIGGSELLQGLPGRMSIVGWRTWKLKRKAISTNDGEIQAMLEGEDNNFRTRLLWCELNGCSGLPRVDLLDRANVIVKHVEGINGTDSKGGFDAVKRNEGPLLGLTNARSALQAYQLREQLEQGCGRLIWLSGDWNLSDALTKKSKDARMGLLQFLRNFTWQLYFDPNFVVSEKKAKKSGQTALKQMRELQALVPYKW